MTIEDVVNAEDLENIKTFAFEFTCQEADYLGLEKQGEIFRDMCKIRVGNLLDDINHVFNTALTNGLFYVNVYIPKIKNIPEIVDAIYSSDNLYE